MASKAYVIAGARVVHRAVRNRRTRAFFVERVDERFDERFVERFDERFVERVDERFVARFDARVDERAT